jgi:hypothetical protein
MSIRKPKSMASSLSHEVKNQPRAQGGCHDGKRNPRSNRPPVTPPIQASTSQMPIALEIWHFRRVAFFRDNRIRSAAELQLNREHVPKTSAVPRIGRMIVRVNQCDGQTAQAEA